MDSAVLVPIKAFGAAKLRLAPALPPAARAELVQAMAARVLAAAAPLPVAVVCDDEDVARFAEAHGAGVIWTPGLGLDGAVTAGVEHLRRAGHEAVVCAHADLPLADRFDHLADRPGTVTLVPDRRDDGTNVIVVPSDVGFRFAYGAGSFARHRAEAETLGLRVRIVRDERLGWDVDVPADLDVPAALGGLACG
ncbi:MAG: 2-phospho-L-lactate guanylyltransferase [Acidimicrobiales bacterium]